MKLTVEAIDSPIGRLYLAAHGPTLCALAFADRWDRDRTALMRRFQNETLTPGCVDTSIRRALDRYFAGDLTAVDHIAVDLGGTAFQQQVWAALREVPAGRTASYADIAAAIGQPTATRAVGTANGRNPVSVVIPCHRIIGADGKLHGYGGGLVRKRWLLEHERALLSLF